MSDTRVNRKSRSKSSPKQRHRAAGEVLRARPVEGEVNHSVLTRKIIARFPKILAALAK
jgi:hypothetical protein